MNVLVLTCSIFIHWITLVSCISAPPWSNHKLFEHRSPISPRCHYFTILPRGILSPPPPHPLWVAPWFTSGAYLSSYLAEISKQQIPISWKWSSLTPALCRYLSKILTVRWSVSSFRFKWDWNKGVIGMLFNGIGIRCWTSRCSCCLFIIRRKDCKKYQEENNRHRYGLTPPRPNPRIYSVIFIGLRWTCGGCFYIYAIPFLLTAIQNHLA